MNRLRVAISRWVWLYRGRTGAASALPSAGGVDAGGV